MQFTFYTYLTTTILTGSLSLILGLFIYSRRKDSLGKSALFLCLSISLWSFGLFIHALMHNYAPPALFWSRFAHVGAILIPALYLQFVINFTGTKRWRAVLNCTYILSFMFLIFNFTKLFIKQVNPILIFRNYPRVGPAYPFFILIFVSCIILGLYILFRAFGKAAGVKRNQIKYLLAGSIIGFGGGPFNFVPMFGISLFPYGYYFVWLYVVFLSYAITKHRLMDINVVITRGTVFAVVYTFVLGIPIAVGFWGRDYLFEKIGVNWWLVPTGMMLILASLGPTIYGFIRRKTEATLFKERQRYQENLIALAKQMTLTKDLRQLLVLIIRRVTGEIGISHARIYLLDRKANEYMREVRYGRERRKQFGDSLSQDAPLIQMLYKSRDRGPLLGEEVISHFETSKPEYLEEVKAQLRSMGASLLIPAFIGEEMIAFLSLGTKRSREIYTPDDLNMFKILGTQAALAIENALFYRELKEAQAAMVETARLSTVGELATGFAHQIDNPLGIISAGCQLCVMDIKDWLNRENLPEGDAKILLEMEDRMDKVIDTAHRAADLVQRIKGYAKPSDRDFEATDLNSVIEDALILAQYHISHGGISVNKNIPQDLPKVKGIGVHLEQALLNMIINACDAMAGKKGELTISVGVKSEDGRKVEVALSDNGCGIPEENLRKLFDIFFTTKGPQGTGMGLSMAYRIIKDHNGDIKVESEVGKGTKFTVSLPIWEEKP
jgi:signal transduction histidine kinase